MNSGSDGLLADAKSTPCCVFLNQGNFHDTLVQQHEPIHRHIGYCVAALMMRMPEVLAEWPVMLACLVPWAVSYSSAGLSVMPILASPGMKCFLRQCCANSAQKQHIRPGLLVLIHHHQLLRAAEAIFQRTASAISGLPVHPSGLIWNGRLEWCY